MVSSKAHSNGAKNLGAREHRVAATTAPPVSNCSASYAAPQFCRRSYTYMTRLYTACMTARLNASAARVTRSPALPACRAPKRRTCYQRRRTGSSAYASGAGWVRHTTGGASRRQCPCMALGISGGGPCRVEGQNCAVLRPSDQSVAIPRRRSNGAHTSGGPTQTPNGHVLHQDPASNDG